MLCVCMCVCSVHMCGCVDVHGDVCVWCVVCGVLCVCACVCVCVCSQVCVYFILSVLIVAM